MVWTDSLYKADYISSLKGLCFISYAFFCVPNIDLQLFVDEGDLNMKCSIKNPHKIILGGPRSVDHGGQIPHEMINETEGKAVFTIIRACSMGCNSI